MSTQVNSYLTGRRRYREASKYAAGFQVIGGTYLVLQVEKSVWKDSIHGVFPGKWVCKWFDATPADVGKDELCGS